MATFAELQIARIFKERGELDRAEGHAEQEHEQTGAEPDQERVVPLSRAEGDGGDQASDDTQAVSDGSMVLVGADGTPIRVRAKLRSVGWESGPAGFGYGDGEVYRVEFDGSESTVRKVSSASSPPRPKT